MIGGLTVLLGFQLAGEVVVRALDLPVPGPVLGMAALLVAMVTVPKLADVTAPVARVLLTNLSLLFVPAGVGIVRHLDKLGSQGGAIVTAVVLSTALAIAVGAGVFVLVARMTGTGDE
jgi:holin-like protein